MLLMLLIEIPLDSTRRSSTSSHQNERLNNVSRCSTNERTRISNSYSMRLDCSGQVPRDSVTRFNSICIARVYMSAPVIQIDCNPSAKNLSRIHYTSWLSVLALYTAPPTFQRMQAFLIAILAIVYRLSREVQRSDLGNCCALLTLILPHISRPIKVKLYIFWLRGSSKRRTDRNILMSIKRWSQYHFRLRTFYLCAHWSGCFGTNDSH